MMVLVAALSIGVIAGLRTMTAPAAVSLAALLGWLELTHTPLAFMGSGVTAAILTLAALGEFVVDQLPTTPSRTSLLPLGARLVSGGLCGAAIGVSAGALWPGLIAGSVGATIGTFGGHAARLRLAVAFKSDRPAGFLEDALAVVAALAIVASRR